MVNRFRAGQGPRRANLHKWGIAQSHSCDCGQRWTMNHIVDTCPLTKFEGAWNLLHEVDDDSHMAGIYSNCSTCEIINSVRRLMVCLSVANGRSGLSGSVPVSHLANVEALVERAAAEAATRCGSGSSQLDTHSAMMMDRQALPPPSYAASTAQQVCLLSPLSVCLASAAHLQMHYDFGLSVRLCMCAIRSACCRFVLVLMRNRCIIIHWLSLQLETKLSRIHAISCCHNL